MSGPGRPGGGTDGRTYQSCPRTKSAQNMVPCAAQYTGHTAQLSMPAAAAAPSAATTATSRATYHSDRQGLLRQQCSGTAARTSPMRNGGGFPASKAASTRPRPLMMSSSVAFAAAS